MVELLKDEAYLDAGPYSLAFDLLPEAVHGQGVELAITLVLLILASYDERVMVGLEEWPLLFMHVVEVPGNVSSDKRKEIAAKLMGAQDFGLGIYNQ